MPGICGTGTGVYPLAAHASRYALFISICRRLASSCFWKASSRICILAAFCSRLASIFFLYSIYSVCRRTYSSRSVLARSSNFCLVASSASFHFWAACRVASLNDISLLRFFRKSIEKRIYALRAFLGGTLASAAGSSSSSSSSSGSGGMSMTGGGGGACAGVAAGMGAAAGAADAAGATAVIPTPGGKTGNGGRAVLPPWAPAISAWRSGSMPGCASRFWMPCNVGGMLGGIMPGWGTDEGGIIIAGMAATAEACAATAASASFFCFFRALASSFSAGVFLGLPRFGLSGAGSTAAAGAASGNAAASAAGTAAASASGFAGVDFLAPFWGPGISWAGGSSPGTSAVLPDKLRAALSSFKLHSSSSMGEETSPSSHS
mmetsp:Transcript_24741/g.68901  ORF Transcript_24741/g.68901 Transcript_24741/m.68901 type:complete len:377 (-) Transcript_24741:884-2014(-)